MNSIQQNIEQITSQILSAQQKCGRAQESVQLLAVSKTKPNQAVLEAAQAGHTAF
ncbi:MAG TPA: YggS family pyridoxal phosphate enzyme, partial [Vibrio sp.]|nr:YggS family pyridoxal phosphate enzyme [Vibrio sp.]